jgi:SAM-dependent methyltransferase
METAACNCCGAREWSYAFTENGFDLGRCDRCGLYYVRPMPTLGVRMTEMESSHFAGDLMTSDADLHLAQERALREELGSYVDAIARRGPPPGRWLDVGCGAGTLLSLIQARGYTAEGVELTKDRRDVAQRETGCVVYDAPIETLGLPAESYAVVTMINVFSHLTDPMGTLASIANVLLDGGLLLLRTGEIGHGVKRHHAFSWDLGDHLYYLGEDTIRHYAESLGFEILSRDRDWAPATTYTRERFLLKGRSRVRNVIKEAIAYTPGALPLLRWYMLQRRHVDNPVYISRLLLRRSSQR